ncbi:PilW family protein [Shewanella cyperi]|uniref:PilW family protein n=3 Tax=Shewanellaceae TaxID=267890 RepID=A0A975AMF1_9GAMM|nr:MULTISPECIES: PilW family protein [Shewanella]QSX31771.1 PilW family protein [Shewanella cyperi]QSX38988.1 PilW family protein [Shewanella sedimentimangrovi]
MMDTHRGFSLVELMVASVISLFLALGLFTMFSMSQTNVTTTSQLGQLQENGRIALALMERDISQLGFMGDITGTDLIVGSNTTLVGVPPAVFNDCVGAGANNATFPGNISAHFRKLWGYENGVSANSLACLNGVKARTDVIQIKRLIGPSVVNPSDAGRFYMATTSNEAIIFQGTGAPPVLASGRYWEYQHHIYFIADNAEGIPELRRKTLSATGLGNDEQLVEGIENMRIMYGFDNDGDDAADSYMPVQNVTTLMWDNALFQRLVSLRIFLLVRSTEEDDSYTNDVTYTLGDKTIAATNDHFRRKVVSTTIVLENPVLIRN